MSASKKTDIATQYKIAIIGAIAVVIGGLFAGPFILRWLPNSTPRTEQIAVRVADSTGASISGAKVLFFFEGGALSQFTDVNGISVFNITNNGTVRLIVEADQYNIYEQEIQLPNDKSIDIRLKEQTGSEASVIFRVVDDVNSAPIPGAKVLLIVQDSILSEATDSNGISKFTLVFPGEGKTDAQMSVSTNAYEIKDQNITLMPNRVQDVRLNPSRETLEITEVAPQLVQPSQQQTILPQQNPAAVPPKVRNAVTVEAVTSTLVDLDTGFSVSEEPSPSEEDNGELKVIIRTPDNQPFISTYIAVYTQKTDLNNQSIRGDRAGERRTDDTGIATFVLPPGTYGIYPDIAGVPWTGINSNQRVEADKRTTITIVPSRLIIIIRRADDSLITNSYISISTQKIDVNGKPLPDKRVLEARTKDTGEAIFDLSPGVYAIYLDAARGEDWGSLDNELPPGTQLTYNVTLGRIRIESRDDKGNIVSGFYSQVFFEKKNANDRTIPGDKIAEGRTDDTGAFNYDLTPGTYIVQSDAGSVEVPVRSGEIITIKNADFVKS